MEIFYEVLELNTRIRRHKSDIEDILYGDNNKKHQFKTEEEALEKQDELNKKGIKTSLAVAHYS